MPPRLEATVVVLALAYIVYENMQGGGGSAATIDGITFPAEYRASGTTQILCGGGTRLKYNVVKVYAVGLYIDPQAASKGSGFNTLKPFKATSAAELGKSTAFYKSLIEGGFAKSLLLQFHRSVGADAVAGAMRDSLSKRLNAASLKKFSDTLSQTLGGAAIAQGARLSFGCKADAMQITYGTITSAALREKGLCSALFSVYYGSSPIAPAAKEGAAKAFAAMYA